MTFLGFSYIQCMGHREAPLRFWIRKAYIPDDTASITQPDVKHLHVAKANPLYQASHGSIHSRFAGLRGFAI